MDGNDAAAWVAHITHSSALHWMQPHPAAARCVAAAAAALDAAAEGGGSAHLRTFLQSEAGGQASLMLVAALAAGELREKMQLDVQPLLTVQDSTATLELLAVKLSSKGAI